MTKYEAIISEVKKVVSQYTSRLTLRQIYYRLVAKLIIQNTRSQYQYLSKTLVKARKEGDVPYNIMEDRTRDVRSWIDTSHVFWKTRVKWRIDEVRRPPYVYVDHKVFQKDICLIALEKEALAGIFSEQMRSMCILVVCRGYNSLTQIKELADLLHGDHRNVNCYFFSDFDPSGFDIQKNFKSQCEELGIVFHKFERIALKEQDIQFFQLPYAPTKRTDPRSGNWNHPGVVELDALEPNVLIRMINECIDECYDDGIEEWKERVARVQRRRAVKLYSKKLKALAEEIADE